MKMRMLFGLLAIIICGSVTAQNKPKLNKYGVDPARIVNGEYRGRFAPDADYVLNGQLRKDFEPLPKVSFYYVKDSEGYDPKALSKVPAPGIHPRVLMSPSDIEEIKKKYKSGDKAGRIFKVIWNDIKSAKPMQHLHGLTSSALVALVTEDEKLGKELAKKLVEYAKFQEPAIDLMNTHPDMAAIKDWWFYYSRSSVNKVGGMYYKDAYEKGGAKLIHELAKKSVEFSPGNGGKKSKHLFNTELRAYDYIAPFMTEDQKKYVRKVIAKATAGKFTSGMGLPGHMFINNHMSMGEDLLITHLAIEGEEGYDPRILKAYAPCVRDKITYDVSLDGIMHEKLKGFLPERAVLAISRRADKPETGALPLLRHSHLKAFVWAKALDSINIYSGIKNDLGKMLNTPRRWWQGYGSGPWMDQYVNWCFLLKKVYPKDPVVDYFYKERLYEYGSGRTVFKKFPKPRIAYTWRDIMAWGATRGLLNDKGEPIDYNLDGLPKELTKNKKAFVDMQRGVAVSRSSWDKDAMIIHYECRSDCYMAGHETPEAGDFNLSADGIIWSMRREWYMDCYFRNMVLIDGKAGQYGPSAGKLMKVVDNDSGTTFISDATMQYNWEQGGKCFDDWHNMYKEAGMHMDSMRSSNMMDRGSEVASAKHMRDYDENFAGLDWGGWHGEERGPQYYHRYNHVDHVFRNLHMTKGETPYALVIDDVNKDGKKHQYDWCFHVEKDIALYAADSSVRNRYLPRHTGDVPGGGGGTTDLILCLKDVKEKRYDRYGIKANRVPEKGDPMLLVRVLYRETKNPFPQPAFETSAARGGVHMSSRVKVPALAVDPKFRVLLFPHKFGEKLPMTFWNDDKTKLTVEVGGNTDVYTFDKTDRDRTVFTVERNGKLVSRTGGSPAAPLLETPQGWEVDQNTLDANRQVVFSGTTNLIFKPTSLGQLIRYTTDGSEPTKDSTLYSGPIKVNKSCTVKARTLARYWPFGKIPYSKVTSIDLVKRDLAPAVSQSGLKPGLGCEVFEKHFTHYDDKTGIWTGKKNMLPKLVEQDKILTCLVSGFAVPQVKGKLPAVEQAKSFYRYKGFIKVPKDGIYGFKINSCSPIVLDIAGQKVVNMVGPYGTSMRLRYGQAALKAGLHPIELVVCDPYFWKTDILGAFPLSVEIMVPGTDKYVAISASELLTADASLKPQAQPEIPVGKAVKPGKVETGLVMKCYDRTNRFNKVPKDGVPADFFTITAKDKPYWVEPVMSIDASDSGGRLADYTGFLIIDTPGLYEFKLDNKGANQLLIDDILVAQNRTEGKIPHGKIKLDKGYHKFNLRLAGSKGIFQIKAPGKKDFASTNIGLFARKGGVKKSDDGRLMLELDGENMDSAGILKHKFGPIVAKLRKGKLVDGVSGKGMRIQGNDSWMEIEGLRSPEDAFSLAFWMRFDGAPDRGLLGNSWEQHPGARLRGYNIWAYYFRGSPNATFDMRKVGAQKKGWHQIVLTYDKGGVKVFVDGKLRDWQAKTTPQRRAYVKDLRLFESLDCTVDEIGIYNKALTAEEVKALFGKHKDAVRQ